MIRGQLRTIVVDGKTYPAQYLGRGSFSTAYAVAGGKVVLYTKCEDYSKEAIALWVHHPIKHIPYIVRHDDYKGKCVYSVPMYHDIHAADKEAWVYSRILTMIWKQAEKEVIREVQSREGTTWYIKFWARYGFDTMTRTLEIAKGTKLPHSLITALEELLHAFSNYGSGICFDFKRSNFGVDQNGVLILRDVMWVCAEDR